MAVTTLMNSAEKEATELIVCALIILSIAPRDAKAAAFDSSFGLLSFWVENRNTGAPLTRTPALRIHQGPGFTGTACDTVVAPASSSTMFVALRSATISTTRVSAGRPELSVTVTVSPGDTCTSGVRTSNGLPLVSAPIAAPSDAGFEETAVSESPVGAGTTAPPASSY